MSFFLENHHVCSAHSEFYGDCDETCYVAGTAGKPFYIDWEYHGFCWQEAAG